MAKGRELATNSCDVVAMWMMWGIAVARTSGGMAPVPAAQHVSLGVGRRKRLVVCGSGQRHEWGPRWVAAGPRGKGRGQVGPAGKKKKGGKEEKKERRKRKDGRDFSPKEIGFF